MARRLDAIVPSPDEPPRVMAVLNVTPDSLSGDGLAGDPEALIARACQAVDDGADLLDLGGESTRPGAGPVSVEEELARVLSVLPALVERLEVPISIDTQKPVVADVALAAGAIVLNDVSGLADLELATVAAQHGSHLVLTHNGWTMGRPAGEDDVIRGLHSLVDRAVHAGVEPDHLIVDPGLGFGKPPELSLALLRHMGELCTRLAPLPVLVGPSRKGFIGHVLGLPANDRLEGSLACVAIAALGGASMVRVHDVKPCTRAARMGWAIRGRPRPPK